MPERKQASEEEEFNLVDHPELLHDKFIELSLPNLQHMFPYIRDIDLVVDIIDSLAVKIDTTLLNNPFGLAAPREMLYIGFGQMGVYFSGVNFLSFCPALPTLVLRRRHVSQVLIVPVHQRVTD